MSTILDNFEQILFDHIVSVEPGADNDIFSELIRQSIRGFGHTGPNPPVGCVIVDKNQKMIATGYHKKVGDPHAEIEVLKQIAPVTLSEDKKSWTLDKKHFEVLEGATFYVTLEPCAHQGRTPSCAMTLSKLPIKKVVTLLNDPNPLVSGQGFAILNQAQIVTKCLETQNPLSPWVLASKVTHEFFLNSMLQNNQRPFVTVKLASSLDGKMGLDNGQSQWITNSLSRDFARYLRGAHQAIAVGKNTILQDNPRLDARQTDFEGVTDRQLFIFDSSAQVAQRLDLNIFKTYSASNITILALKDKTNRPLGFYVEKDYNLLIAPSKQSMWQVLLEHLAQNKIISLWVEGGPSLIAEALELKLAQRLWLFQGLKILGGHKSWSQNLTFDQMNEVLSLSDATVSKIQNDILISGLLKVPASQR